MNEIELSGNRYSVGRLNAKQQFHLSRRIAPLIPPLIPVYQQLARSGAPLGEDGVALADLLQPLMDGLASMDDADADRVFELCLSAVQRHQGASWVNVWNGQHGVCLFQDMDLGVVLPLVMRVITTNLGPFMLGLLTSQGSGPEQTTA